MKKPFLLLSLTLVACHASCGETAGPDPTATAPEPDAAAPATTQPFNKRSMQRRPGMRSITPIEPTQGQD
jgi:hypothetical protein